jgi:competence ComEA-like helix-hairpin-helix protein
MDTPCELQLQSWPLESGDRIQVSEQDCRYQPSGMSAQSRVAIGLPLLLNQATKNELTLLPGVGASLAQAIVAHRETHGPFANVGALGEVKGIGEVTLETLKPYVALQDRRWHRMDEDE